ncbi:unnamed protein product, partial [Boreogadus saida]
MYAIMAFLLIFNHGRDVLRVREISSPAYVVQHSSGLHEHHCSLRGILKISPTHIMASPSTTTTINQFVCLQCFTYLLFWCDVI